MVNFNSYGRLNNYHILSFDRQRREIRNKNARRSGSTLTREHKGLYLENSVELPVCPVDLVLEDVEGVRMKEIMTVGDDLLSS